MKTFIVMFMLLLCNVAIGAATHWEGIHLSNGDGTAGVMREFHFSTDICGDNGEYAWMHSFIYGHIDNGNLYLKHMDFSLESIEPTFNWWALAVYGDTVREETFNSLKHIEDFYSNDLYTGGTLVENPDDFYMAFNVSEVLINENYDYVAGQTWYGWVHVSIDENLKMTLLGDGINLYGGAVTVGEGATPESASGLLLLVGGALLWLKRPVSSMRFESK